MAGSDEDFLSRWSRRKRAVRAGVPVEEAQPALPAAPGPATAPAVPDARAEAAQPAESLPSVETLTPDSDFKPFMDGKVDPGIRRQALKKLFDDPRFNVMDRMDVYIDDYSIPDPLPQEWLGKLSAMAGLGDVPGREKAEREAREAAEREVAAGAGDPPGPDAEGAPAAAAQPETGPGADEGQVETSPEPSGCVTPSIPALKVGD